MIDTTGASVDRVGSEMGGDLDQIDEIIKESKSFSKAVSESQRPNLGNRLQAEPSRFYMAAQVQDRKNTAAKTAAGAKDAADGQEEEKQENWVVTDKMPMINFKQLVQDPALDFAFELDDF